jgi:hypothetical protein
VAAHSVSKREEYWQIAARCLEVARTLPKRRPTEAAYFAGDPDTHVRLLQSLHSKAVVHGWEPRRGTCSTCFVVPLQCSHGGGGRLGTIVAYEKLHQLGVGFGVARTTIFAASWARRSDSLPISA